MLLQASFEDHALRFPGAPAVIEESSTITYGDLDHAANRLAAGLQQDGVTPGQPVVILVPRSTLFIQSVLAVLKAGAVSVPLDVDDARRVYIARHTGAVAALTHPGPDTAVENAGVRSIPVPLDSPPGEFVHHPAEPRQLAFIFYTSGSTGRPNGVMISHRARLNRLRWEVSEYGITAADAVLFRTPVSFARMVKEVMWGLSSGARLVLARHGSQNDPDYIIDLIRSRQVTVATFTPSMLSMLVENNSFAACGSLRLILSEGEPLRGDLSDRVLAALPGITLYNPYGMTEVSTVSASKCYPGRLRTATRIGKPAGIDVYVLDENTQPVADGQVGELCIAGEGIAAGYINDPALTARRFVPDPCSAEDRLMFKSGDLVRRGSDGELEYMGRADAQVKIRGHRVEPAEVESVIASHPDVDQVMIVKRETRFGSSSLIAFVSPRQGASVTRRAIRSFAADRLPEYMVPAHIVILQHGLPRLANGKTDRSRLRELSRSTVDRPPEAEYVAPETKLEAELVEIWEGILGVQPVGATDNFFEMGGDSLLALQVVLQLERARGMRLSLAAFAEAPTIRQLAAILASPAQACFSKPLVCIQKAGNLPPFFCVHGMFGNVLCFEPLARALGTNQPFYGLQNCSADRPYTVESLATEYLNAVRDFQPRGPYYLGGYSFGGLVAFEMARQLVEAGEPAPHLALVDCAAPSFRRGLLPFEHSVGLLLRDGEPDACAGFALRLSITNDGAGPRVNWSFEPQPRNVGMRFYRAGRYAAAATYEYRPAAAPVHVTLFRTRSTESRLHLEPHRGWSSLALGGVTVIDIDGDHVTCLVRPWVNSLADALAGQWGPTRQPARNS